MEQQSKPEVSAKKTGPAEEVVLRNPGDSDTHYEKTFVLVVDDTDFPGRDAAYCTATRQDAINHGLHPTGDASKEGVKKIRDGIMVTYKVPVTPASVDSEPAPLFVAEKDQHAAEKDQQD